MAPIKKSHTITLRVIDQPGVLVRVAQVFDSLHVTAVPDAQNQADIIIKARGDSQLLHQVTCQLQKIINVLDVKDTL